ncbi:hypothetical protein [Spirosoma validum]|uniref:Uncharacterized protein n=1 Tax=Spirosoma validum TaxID=2771355 RepID=A0A927B7Z6_9BACT|nr:hypothetical protein [Spirosoma validum]MBD2757140.1 hypothetical protein [Spirosoma validum]
MKLVLTPVEVPFMVGDTVWVDQPLGTAHEFPYFQATILQIILDGSLRNSLLVRQRSATHELTVSSAIYSLKPVGQYAGLPRINVELQLIPFRPIFFETKEELMDYRNRLIEAK